MKRPGINKALLVGLISVGAPFAGVHAGPLALSDTPLVVSTSVEPNVMLLIDNSGSMEQIIWADSYDPSNTYPVWQYRNSSGNFVNLPSSGYIRPSWISRGACASGQKRFRKSSSSGEICIPLPDPLGGGNTRIDGNYIRYLLETYPSNAAFTTALSDGTIPNDYRMNVARNVSRNLVANTAGMRFGVSSFNNNAGGRINAVCGSTTTTLTSVIDGLIAETWTPLAESLYEITRYFRGLSSHYNSSTSYTSPIQYRCQKNFSIVVTDGLPTYDTSFPTNDPDDSSGVLPDWDGLSPATSTSDAPNFPQYSDGFQPSGNQSDEGHSLYLDDIAKFAWDIDFMKTGNDTAGESYNDARFPKQNMYTYSVGFTAANQMLLDAAEYGNGQYYTANNAAGLSAVLEQALKDIQDKLGSSASAAANAGFVGAGTKVYQARFNSTDWSGQLLAFSVDDDPTSATYGQVATTGSGPDGSLWDAGSQIPGWSARTVLTRKNGSGIPFRWGQFSAAEHNAYFDDDEDLLDFLRGRDDVGFRSRTTLLGDIVHSAPVFVGAPNARYPDSLETNAYSSFRTAYAGRPKMIYVGANDGMMHGFDADTGVEKLAYIPSVVLASIKQLSDTDYRDNHRFFVDGSPTVVDAYVGASWTSILVGGLNNGGQAIYALDVTNPMTANFTEANASSIVLWEFTDADDADLGYTYSQPAVVKLQSTNGWAAVFGNGYNNTVADGSASATGNAVLYIVDIETGALIRKIDTGVGMAQDPTGQNRPNGLATVAPVDLDGDYKVDAVYAGDLFGNLWKFDLSHSNANQWVLAYKLYEACAQAACTATNRQPITTRPSVSRHPKGEGQIVLFGTGKYLEQGDNIALDGGVQSFYGIWDRGTAANVPTDRSQLQEQSIQVEQNFPITDPNGVVTTYPLRVTSNNAVNWNSVKGWYLDLVSPNGFEGERQVTNSVIRNNRVIFTTLIPTTDPCRPGGDSWLMELDVATGARLAYTPFDLDMDGQFSTADYVTVIIDTVPITVPVSGMKLEGGAAAAPSIMAAEGGREFKYISTADGLETVMENPGAVDTGRQSWRQLGR